VIVFRKYIKQEGGYQPERGDKDPNCDLERIFCETTLPKDKVLWLDYIPPGAKKPAAAGVAPGVAGATTAGAAGSSGPSCLGSDEWTTHLCSCLGEDPKASRGCGFCCGLLCPCCIGGTMMATAVNEELLACNAVPCPFIVGCLCTNPCCLGCTAEKLAEKMNIPETCLFATLKSTFCFPCYLGQMFREFNHSSLRVVGMESVCGGGGQ